MFALIDANSFYASAEQVFDPAVRRRPLVVLTNNDGCICALSDEAKQLGIKKFGPYYQSEQILRRHNATIRSSNYALYDDLSNKMMRVIGRFGPRQHVYSIDECFLDLRRWQPTMSWERYANAIRDTVFTELRLPVSIGIGATPTLAKAASFAAKQLGSKCGISVLRDATATEAVLKQLEVQQVWGIGKRLAARLNAMHIHSAWALSQASARQLRQYFSVEVERTVRELNGVVCLDWDTLPLNKQQLFSTRAFGAPVTSLSALRQALAWHGERIALKLRQQNCGVKTLTAFAHANPFAKHDPFHRSTLHTFEEPTSDTRDIVGTLTQLAPKLFESGVLLHKCGAGAIDIIDSKVLQKDLFAHSTRTPALMACMDAINRKFGTNTLGMAAKGQHAPWHMKRQFLSPQYTTNWRHIPIINCE
ncbi:Y-family DNA polymerase [Salinimonas sediminis]|uniref:Y-family DNA polymerase n=1 Tax=Salinimonas sediminis TaxID=2303538 RepID=A0A346NHW8_9ALTE|nr:Y-family DNA polymerase [Salinimonas sediminis]AXR05125.1 Y-family DNA polymerase [Salinimonas sediminis]